MKITVIPTAKDVDAKELQNETVLVIDVLRATSVMVTALYNGAKEIFPVYTLEEAREHGSKNPKVLLGGERGGHKQEGFHFGNSPLEYMKEAVEGRSIAASTTNGTRGIRNSEGAKEIYILSFLNAQAVAETVKDQKSLSIVCAGTEDHFSIDDGVCAGYLIDLLQKNTMEMNDMALTCLTLYKSTQEDLHHLIGQCQHYQYLKKAGYEEDLQYCLQKSILDVVPAYKDGKIVNLTLK